MTHPTLRRLRAAVLTPALAALAACTGIQEAPTPLNLIIADQAGQEFRIVRVDEEAPSTTPVAVDGTVRGLVTVNAGRQVAALIGPDDVDYATRVELLSGDLAPITTFRADATLDDLPGFEPCYREIAADNRGARVAVYSTCGAGLPQWVLLFDADGTLVLGADVTGFTDGLSYLGSGDRIMLGVVANTVVLGLTSNIGSRLIRIPDVGPVVGFVEPLPTVRDVTTVNETVIVVTVEGTTTPVRPIVDNQFGTPLLGLQGFGTIERAWGAQRLLALYNPNLGRLTVSDLVNSITPLFVSNLVDVTITPDGFLYALQDPTTSASASSITRYDVGRISPDFDTRRAAVPVDGGLLDARYITWVLPADVTVAPELR